MNTKIENIANRSIQGEKISYDDAYYLMCISGNEIYDLFYWANSIRYKSFKNVIRSCSIISVKQGRCSEDCKFCSQSVRYKTSISSFPLIEKEEIAKFVERGNDSKTDCIGIVTSGYSLEIDKDYDRICEYICELSKEGRIPIHTSIGTITYEMAKKLADNGVEMINHNLETSERYFPNICTTHSYSERADTIRNAKDAGMKVCSGGIFGVGESVEDRLDLAFELRALDVDAIPLNFLSPINGTPLCFEKPVEPMEILKIIAVFRFIFPDKEIKVAGGREANLRDLQSWMFYAGANSTMIGNYLTTKGKSPEEDLQMIKDLNLVHENGNVKRC
ncbi:MAG: biotin synthase BioB [Candidatus Scalinduaceae bacterium]